MENNSISEQAARIVDIAGQAGGLDEVRRLADSGWPADRELDGDSDELRAAIQRRATAVAVLRAARKATVRLTSYNMGDATEQDFDQFASYVAARIDAETGLDVEVDQFRFGESVWCDEIRAASDVDRETVKAALAQLWETWCADGDS